MKRAGIVAVLLTTCLSVALAFCMAPALCAERGAAPDENQDWLVPLRTDEPAPFFGAFPTGRIAEVDVDRILAEDAETGRELEYRTDAHAGMILRPHESDAEAERLCRFVAERDGGRGRVWLRNGDEFPCEIVRLDRRRLRVRAFGIEIEIPRGRVLAVRFDSRERRQSLLLSLYCHHN